MYKKAYVTFSIKIRRDHVRKTKIHDNDDDDDDKNDDDDDDDENK